MEGKIRVLNLTLGLAIGEPLGGAERFVIDLSSHLDKSRFEPIVCAFWRYGVPSEQYWAEYLTKRNVKVFFAEDWAGRYSVLRYVKGLMNIASYLRERPVDVIHSHFQMGSIAALLLKGVLGAKAIIRTAHAGKEWGDTFLGFLCRQIFTKWIFPAVFDIEVGVSNAIAARLNQRPGVRIAGKKAVVIRNGIPLDRFISTGINQSKRLELGLSADDLVVGTIGRLRKEKGLSTLLEAAAIVNAQLPNVKFLIVGDGELRSSLCRQAEQLGLMETVLFAGARQDVESLYGVMDLFVLPSLWEGFPIVILESMASRVPVVATDIPGTRELIQAGRTGWLAKPGDPFSLAACILEALLNPSKRAVVVQTAFQEVVLRFSIKGVVAKYEDIYAQLSAKSL